LIYLYVGLGMAMLLPIMVGLQTAVSVSELEQGERSFQFSSGKALQDWEGELDLKSAASLASAGDGNELVDGYVVRAAGNNGYCLVPKGSDEKCPVEY